MYESKQDLISSVLSKGEGINIEFKNCTSSLNNSVFETVSSFSNRFGGYLILGVDDNGKVIGINEKASSDMKRNFINVLNNPNKMNPSLFLELNEFSIDGKLILWVYVPASSDVVFCDGKIFDRNGDADQNITNSVDRVADMFTRKSRQYTEKQIFPYLREENLRMDLIPMVKQLAAVKNANHPWLSMSPMELFRSSGLYEENFITGEKGFNLASVLLFGKDEVIQSCLPGYRTDAIYRDRNEDRYDDRAVVETNLIEAYDILMDFTRKHTDDRFFIVDGLSTGVRDIIAREVLCNMLIHREYSSAFPAKLIIDRNTLRTENWNKAVQMGILNPETFTPYPKNPLLAKFFMNINRADTLGSGVRNLFRYTKMYSGGTPVLEEGDVFTATIPLNENANNNNAEDRIVDYLKTNGNASTSELADALGYKSRTSVHRKLSTLLENGEIKAIGSGKNTKYYLR